MKINNEKDIISLIQNDKWMMDILKTTKILNLPDWWVCVGFVRSLIWDVLHDFPKRTPLLDIDVIYYDLANISEAAEKTGESTEKTLSQCTMVR